MIIYIVGLVIASIFWAILTGGLTVDAFDGDRQSAKYARRAWLSFFLLPDIRQ